MKTFLRMAAMILIVLSLLLLSGRPGLVSALTGSEGWTHSVVRGDTLWDVTQQYLSNPFFWPKVWQYNPHIENPHLIYPGERINVPTEEELARMGAGYAPGYRAGASVIEGQIAYVGGYLVERDLFESCGFVVPHGEQAGSAAIVSSWEEKNLLTDRDLVHVSLGSRENVKAGDMFQIIHVGDPVVHPATGRKLGRQATVQGLLKISDVEEKISTARIVKAYNPVEIGDRIRSYTPPALIGVGDLNKEDKSIQGVIVQNTVGKSQLATRDTVYIDRGSEDAVTPGDRFIVYRGGHPYQVSSKDAARAGIQEFPPAILGELVVLKTMPQTSTAVVVEELNEINPGDQIKYSPRSLPPIKKFDIN